MGVELIRQFATRRYNRVVNKAVLDETSKRFLIHGTEKLGELERRVAEAEKRFPVVAHGQPTLQNLAKEAERLVQTMREEHQPIKKLFDAAVTLQRESAPLSERLANLSLTSASPPLPKPVYDRKITLGAHGLHLRIRETLVREALTLYTKQAAVRDWTLHHKVIEEASVPQSLLIPHHDHHNYGQAPPTRRPRHPVPRPHHATLPLLPPRAPRGHHLLDTNSQPTAGGTSQGETREGERG